MSYRKGVTLLELVVILIIIGITSVYCISSYTAPNEQARAANVQNNLLAIYSAEQNYNNNNNGAYCIATTASPTTCDSLADINTDLSLNIQDDGTYKYSCTGSGASGNASPFTCTAARQVLVGGVPELSIVLTLNAPTSLKQPVNQGNPECEPLNASYNNFCP